jgi:catechol-2,3-dioxygenase
MAIHRLNHAVLYVRDVARSKDFYCGALGFEVVSEFPGAGFLRAPASDNDHDLGVFALGDGAAESEAGRRTVGMYHLAWEVDTLGELAELEGSLRQRGALVGASDHGTTKSLYAKDPDGLELEVVWLIPADLIEPDDLAAKATVGPLDLDAELRRFGADARSGLGVSRPASV